MRSSPPSLHRLLPAYRPLVPSTIMRARRQVQRVRDEKFPSVYSSPQSPDAPTNASVPERQHVDWSPVFINPVYQSSPRKIVRTTTGPAAYAPLLVQHALSLGACSQEAEGRAGKASFSDSAICEQTSCMSKQLFFRMEASVANEQSCTSICLSRRSCQHTPIFWCNAH